MVKIMNDKTKETRKLRSLVGHVVSNKMDKTIVVKIETRRNHPLFKKIITTSKKVHAHDEENKCNPGDKVVVIETRPLSRTKRYRLKEIVERAK